MYNAIEIIWIVPVCRWLYIIIGWKNKADKKPITLERERRIMEYVKTYGRITNKEARELLGLADSTTKRILKQMVYDEILKEQGQRRSRFYEEVLH